MRAYRNATTATFSIRPAQCVCVLSKTEKRAGRWTDAKRKNDLQSLAIDVANAPAAHRRGDAAGTGERRRAVELLACIATCRLSMTLGFARAVTRGKFCARMTERVCVRWGDSENERAQAKENRLAVEKNVSVGGDFPVLFLPRVLQASA